eukprot:scaffold48286_cov21-Prasinocladus_malaysianus.AAC.1
MVTFGLGATSQECRLWSEQPLRSLRGTPSARSNSDSWHKLAESISSFCRSAESCSQLRSMDSARLWPSRLPLRIYIMRPFKPPKSYIQQQGVIAVFYKALLSSSCENPESYINQIKVVAENCNENTPLASHTKYGNMIQKDVS